MNTGSVPSLPGKTKSNKDHSSFRLFCIGEPVRMIRWGVRNWEGQGGYMGGAHVNTLCTHTHHTHTHHTHTYHTHTTHITHTTYTPHTHTTHTPHTPHTHTYHTHTHLLADQCHLSVRVPYLVTLVQHNILPLVGQQEVPEHAQPLVGEDQHTVAPHHISNQPLLHQSANKQQ